MENFTDNIFGAVFYLIVAIILFLIYRSKLKSKTVKEQKNDKKTLLYISYFCTFLSICYFGMYAKGVRDKQLLEEQQKQIAEKNFEQNKRKIEEKNKRKEFTSTVEKDKEMKNQKEEAEKSVSELEKLLSAQTQKRNKFARIVTSKIVFSKYEHKEILNYFDKLLNDKNINYIIISLDGEKNYYTINPYLIEEVELNPDFSVKKQIEWFYYKDGSFKADNGKILGK